MFRVKGRYRDQKVELDQPLNLADGAEVEIEVRPIDASKRDDDAWREVGMERLEEAWDNEKDATHDDWRKLYGNGSR